MTERMTIHPRLHACQACGFLSTRGSEFTRVRGVLFDRECAQAYSDGCEPVASWVREKIPPICPMPDATGEGR